MATCRLLLYRSIRYGCRRALRLTVQASIAGLLICVLLRGIRAGETSKGADRRTARFPAGSNPFHQPFSLPEVLDKDRDGELEFQEGDRRSSGPLVELDQDADGLVGTGRRNESNMGTAARGPEDHGVAGAPREIMGRTTAPVSANRSSVGMRTATAG